MEQEQIYPVGARVLIRDAEWRIKRVDAVKEGGYRLTCTGVSNFLRGREATFFTVFDSVRLLLPEETNLVADTSPEFRDSRLYIEALFRSTPQTDSTKICLADKAAMDPLPYQFNPSIQALNQPKARILIADAVGIGKTLEAGILATELIARGRGRRILVVATKAMLNQFQQEFWNRFSIPLVRLDSDGIQRARARLPSNQNPFNYYDRSIISIDTLKQSEYRDNLANAYWDIIIIDEAHNVAVRGSSSQRANLAKQLSTRSDTLIMLSATPHDGRAESFSSLLNMLDPLALTNSKDYDVKDFAEKGLVIRRFKHHVRNQIDKEFPDREIKTIKASASPAETAVYDFLSTVRFQTLDGKSGSGAHLFATVLTKAMFSSPAACLSVIRNRIRRLERAKAAGAAKDIEVLKDLENLIGDIKDKSFSKLMALVDLLGKGDKSWSWNKKDPTDRVVVFTESIETLRYLEEKLPKLCGLGKKEVLVLSGDMMDTKVAEVVTEFNREASPARLLLCSDVASEGINLHHLSHRMIHFDIPWSLMTFQQRNGRIDRYGQTRQPLIRYLQTEPKIEKTIGDIQILEKLVEKDANAQKNIGDPAEFMMTQEEQEDLTAARMEGTEPKNQEDQNSVDANWILKLVFGKEDSEVGSPISPVLTRDEYERRLDQPFRLYGSDFAFTADALRKINEESGSSMDANALEILADENRILLQAPADLRARLQYLPSEVLPEGARFDLTDDVEVVQQEISRARTQDSPWPARQLLWPLHPVMLWVKDRMLGMFGRHSAPVITLPQIKEGEAWVLIQGGYPNRRGYIPIHEWIAVRVRNGKGESVRLAEMIDALGLRGRLSNAKRSFDESFCKASVTAAVNVAREELAAAKGSFDESQKQRLTDQLKEIERVCTAKEKQIDDELGDAQINKKRKQDRKADLKNAREHAEKYIEDTAQTEDKAYLQLVALFVGPLKR